MTSGSVAKNTNIDTLYVNRPVTNAEAVIAWAKANGFKTTLQPDDMHVTVCFSKAKLDWSSLVAESVHLSVSGGQRAIKRFGEEAVVLVFESEALGNRHDEFMAAGASFDYDEYHPHVTLSYDGEIDIDAIVPYAGPIHLGAEEFQPVVEGWKDKVVEKLFKTNYVTMTHRRKAVEKAERNLVRYNKTALRAMAKQASELAAKAYKDVVKASDPDRVATKIIDGLDWSAYVDYTETELDNVVQDAVQQAITSLGVSDDEEITNQMYAAAQNYAHDRAAELVGKTWLDGELIDNPDAAYAITDSLRAGIQELTAQAIDEGWSADTLAEKVGELGNFSDARAEMIARTEIIRANNQGHMVSFKEAGVERKAWSTAEDGDVCEICQGNEDQGPIPIDDDFDSGDDAAPAHPQCRCTIVAIIANPLLTPAQLAAGAAESDDEE